MIACTSVGTGAERRRHLGRFEDAEPAAGAGADEDDAAALPQRLRDDLDADRDAILLALHRREHLAILVEHHVDDVGTGSLSMASVAGLMASVGSDCHFDCDRHEWFRRRALQPLTLLLGSEVSNSRLDVLSGSPHRDSRLATRARADDRRLPEPSARRAPAVGEHARELRPRSRRCSRRSPASAGPRVEALGRDELEAFVREQMVPRPGAAIGRARRSPASAASTGSSRSSGSWTSSPADDLRPPRAWPALPKFLSLEEVDPLIAQPDTSHAARPARPRDDRAALRDRPARLRARQRCAPATCTSTRAT